MSTQTHSLPSSLTIIPPTRSENISFSLCSEFVTNTEFRGVMVPLVQAQSYVLGSSMAVYRVQFSQRYTVQLNR